MPPQSTLNIKNHNALMSEQCTICSSLFELKEGEEPHVIQIDNDYYCEVCLEKRLLEEQQNIRNLQQRYIYYKQYESSFNTKQYCEASLRQNSRNIEDLAELEQLEQEALVLEELLLKAKQQSLTLKQKVLHIEAEEQRFWDSINRFQKRSTKLEEKCLSAKLQLRSFKSEAESLCANSLYHQVFKITIDDNIGYISGLAMGKKSESTQVSWDEFNIGLGHLFLALNIFALKYNYNYVKFQQVYLKSYATQVLLYGKDKKYPISYNKEIDKIFGEVMEALLTQVFHFSNHLLEALGLQYNPQVKLPYPIMDKQSKIDDIFINPNKILEKLKWTRWSEAIKYLLIDWKHLMTIHIIYGKD